MCRSSHSASFAHRPLIQWLQRTRMKQTQRGKTIKRELIEAKWGAYRITQAPATFGAPVFVAGNVQQCKTLAYTPACTAIAVVNSQAHNVSLLLGRERNLLQEWLKVKCQQILPHFRLTNAGAQQKLHRLDLLHLLVEVGQWSYN